MLNLIAEELHRDLGAPTTTTQGIIKFWLRENIGALNTLLGTDYVVDPNTYEISPELGTKEKSIYKKLYSIYYYDYLIRRNSGAASFNSIVEVSSDGATVRKANYNGIVQSLILAKKSEQEDLKLLLNSYNTMGNVLPRQVVGDDIEEAPSLSDSYSRA